MKNTTWNKNNQFPNLPDFDNVKLRELWHEYLVDKVDVKDKLILQFLATGQTILDRMVARNPRLKFLYDDLVSTLTLKTCEWINTLTDPTIIDPVAYYWQMVKYVVQECSAESLIQKGWSVRWQANNDKPISSQEPLDEELLFDQPWNDLDTWDELNTLAETENEKKYLLLRSQRFTNREIAKQLNVSESLCSKMKTTLKARYERLL